MSSIQQEIGEHLTQRTRIDRKVFTWTVVCFDPDTLGVQPRLVKIDYRAQQPRHVGVLWTDGTSEPIHCPVCDLGNAMYFFFGERQIITTFFRESLGFHEVEEIEKRIEGIVDLVSQRGGKRTALCGRPNSLL